MGDRKGENRDSSPSFLHLGFAQVQDKNSEAIPAEPAGMAELYNN